MQKKKVFTVLSIDGGGVRGLVSARLLQEIEARTGKPIAELFDLVGGTSTGSILAVGLNIPDPQNPGKPKFSAKDMLDFYFKYSPKIFPDVKFRQLKHMLPGTTGFYDPKVLEEILQKNFGTTKFKDSLTHLIIPATDIKKYKPTWMGFFKGRPDDDGWGSMLLSDAVRATTAAPTIFPTKYIYTTPNDNAPEIRDRHVFIDGSAFAGMLARKLHTSATKLADPDAEIVVVHIGTGFSKQNMSPDEYNKLSPFGLISKANGVFIVNLTINMTTIASNEDLKDEIGEDHFFSFDAAFDRDDPEGPSPSIDDSGEQNMKRLQKFAERIIFDKSDDIDRLCKVLTDRIWVAELHQISADAAGKLRDKMATTANAKDLDALYIKIVKYSDQPDGVSQIPPEKGDEDIHALAQKLVETDRQHLNRLYQAYHLEKDALPEPGKIEEFKNYGKKLLSRVFGSKSKKANDNAPVQDSTKPAAQKKNQGPKPG